MISRRQLIKSAIALGASTQVPAATRPYPDKPMRFIVPFPPGAGADDMSRMFGQQLAIGLRQPVIVENRAGAGGTIGAAVVANLVADGYSLLMGTSSTMAVNPHLYKTLPYNTLKDFTAVSLLATVPIMLFVNHALPVHSVQQLIDYARRNPGKLNFASAGIGSVGHLSGEMLEKLAGIDIVHIPFTGSAPAMTSLIGAQVQIMFDSPMSGMPYVKAGKIDVLASGGDRRSSLLPGIPTMAESGLSNFRAILWYGLYVRTGTADAIVTRLNAEASKALHDHEFRDRLQRQGFEPAGDSPAQFDAFWRADYARWGNLIASTGVHL